VGAAAEDASVDPAPRATPLARTIDVTLRFPDPALPYHFHPVRKRVVRPREDPARVAVSGRAWPFAVAATADLVSTAWALERGGVERNPLFRPGRLDMVAAKLVQVPLIAKLTDVIEGRYPRAGRYLRYAILVIHAAIAAHNVRMGRLAAATAARGVTAR
jgi:hypothetical protein